MSDLSIGAPAGEQRVAKPDDPQQALIAKQAERLSIRARQVGNLRRNIRQLQAAHRLNLAAHELTIHRDMRRRDELESDRSTLAKAQLENAALRSSLSEATEAAQRWRDVVALVEAESVREPSAGAVILWFMPSNDHDEAKASIQGVAWDNPTRTVWMYEGEAIDEVVREACAILYPDALHESAELRSALDAEREMRLKAFDAMLTRVERYDFTPDGMHDCPTGAWIEFNRLPWQITAALAYQPEQPSATILAPGSVSDTRPTQPEDGQ